MKTLFLPFVFTVFTCLNLLGQQNQSFRGKILYLNSGGQPAIGVQVSGKTPDAATSNTVYTAATGEFSLLFPWAKNGQRIAIEVGNDDAKGQTIEVVNLKEVEQCRMPAKGTDVFEVIVCVKGMREQVAQRYYNIMRSSTLEEIKRLREEVKVMVMGKAQDYALISQLTDKITKLQQQTDSISLYREAYRLASINKDNANARMVKYLELLDEGESIEEALKILDTEKASQEIEADMLSFEAGIEELLTKATGSFLSAEYLESIHCYETIIRHCRKLRIDPLLITYYQGELARVLLYAGKPRAALRTQEETLNILETRIETPDSILARALTSLTFYLNANAKFQEALENCKRTLSIKQTLYPPRHPEFIHTYLNLGNTLRDLGEFKQALDNYHLALSIVELQENPDESIRATLLGNAGVVYRQLGEINSAIAYQERVLEISQRIFGDQHPETAIAISNLSVNYLQLGQYDTVVNALERVIPMLEAKLGTMHLDVAIAYNSLASAYLGLGNYDLAGQYQLKALEIEEMFLDSNHQQLAITYGNLGQVFKEKGQLVIAEQMLEKAAQILEVPTQSNPSLLGQVYHNLSAIQEDLGKYQAALRVQDKALELMQSSLGENHPNLAAAYSNLSILYLRTGQFDEALTLINQAIQIDSSFFGSTGLYLAFDYSNKAGVLRCLGQDETALSLDLHALSIFQKHLSNTHQAFAKLKSGLGKSYAKTGALEEAKKAFEIYEASFKDTPKNYQNWTLYFAAKGETKLALSNLEKALELGFNDLVWLETCSTLKKLRRKTEFRRLLQEIKN